ncbi:MAG: hypothetical protein HFACDABA_00966 [Anaerolineales bacterium]|nr:hypothetical protein [Anaerolineales bacterium]
MRIHFTLLTLLLLSGCLTIETHTPTPLHFVTSTLPALPVVTLTPSRTATPADTLPRPEGCTDDAIFMSDVTIPDGTRAARGQTFTKTWRLRNLGTCPWDSSYQLFFIAGERMGAPDSIPIPVTAPKEDADISAQLTAPSKDGSYTGVFELRDPNGKVIHIGLDKSIWVKIIVGEGAPALPTVAATLPSGGATPMRTATGCTVSANAGYINELLDLINAARRAAGVHALAVNAQLTTAAQEHSRDMACNNFLDHIGSDGSNIGQRILAAGYPASGYIEIIAIGTPQDAMNQWQNDAEHWAAVVHAGMTEIGIGYSYNAQSNYKGYFTVDLGSR